MNPEDIKCYLCPDYKGIMTKVKDNNSNDFKWAHPICVLWNPHIKYDSFYMKDKILGDPVKSSLGSCYFCKEIGYCIQCDFHICSNIFHVKCAVKNGLIKDYSKMIKLYHKCKENPAYVAVFCKEHIV